MDARIAEILDALPDAPGVYLHKDKAGRVLYVGKAKSLRSRVRSYFQPSADHSTRIATMVAQVRDLEVVRTHTEAEALMFEANLIKRFQPRYNADLKDDKSYPFFKLTTGEAFPRLFLVRESLEKDAEYFGPYASVRDARETLQVIRRHFKLRTSKMKLDGTKVHRPCLNFQMKRCLGPCQGDVSTDDYLKNVDRVRLFLLGRDKELIAQMEAEMQACSDDQRYEEAARARNAIMAVKRTLEKQKVVTPDPRADQDVIALYRESHFAGVELLFIRNGRLIGTDFLYWDQTEELEDEQLIRSVLRRLYTKPNVLLPKEVLIPVAVEDQHVMEEYLIQVKGKRVKIHHAQRGHKRKLVEMAWENARFALKERMSRYVDNETVLEETRQRLHLKNLPRRVEAFDISNTAGTNTVASMVVWENNQPLKNEYRKYKIQSVEGADDFKSMFEVLSRRYRRSVTGEKPLPDLILIDGGKGQVNKAQAVLEALGLSGPHLDLIGLAKGRSEKRAGITRPDGEDLEYVVKPGQKNEIRLKKNASSLHFLQRIRDESHRFAITFHRTLRKKETISTELENLPGLGRKRAGELLRHFGSLKRIKEATHGELMDMPGLPEKLSQAIYENYHPTPKT